jgi:hypothetical protein
MNLESQWIAGFVDGEGCFHVQVNKAETAAAGYYVLAEFVVTQHVRSIKVLHAMRKIFKSGVVRPCKDNIYQYRVRKADHLRTRIVPFFMKHKLKTRKRLDFMKFRWILLLMERGEHLTPAGVEKIQAVRATMNGKQALSSPSF